uniref:Endo/exonuclease/phosphatase domain-containing protein n=1 Tax=Mesocestoides corti TaxID=53468 RepID=A0A5K3EL79_MESCO
MTPIPTIYSTDVLTTPESFQVRRPNNLNEFTMQSRLMTEEEAKVGKRSEWFRVNLTGPVKNFPRNLCYLTYITTLVIKNNHLERLPPELGNLVNLVNLDASHNRLRVLPPTLGDLTDLRALILNDNQISDLPLEIGRLLNLRHFNLLDNPLNPETGSLYGDGGEPSIRRMIRHFLDCYYQQNFNSSPPRRQWRQLGSPSKNGYRLTLMCYNVLSSNYATYSQYPYCPTWAIDWEYRRRGILEELRLYAPNIICLQEIDTDQFETVFVPELAKNNYEGIFLAKSRSRTMEPASARKVDGCAIFWLSEKFTKVTEFRYEFMLSCSNVSEHPSPLLLNRVMTRDNVAIGVVLEIKAPSPGNSRRFCVSTGHIHWDPEHSDVKLIQTIIWTAELWSHLDKLCGDSGKPGSGASRMPVVLCGDLNSLPTSGVVEFLSKGCVPTSHVEFLNFGFSYQFEDWKMLEKWAVDGDILRHRFNFDRAYKGGIADGMKITNLTYDFKGMIDYIFFTRHHFRLLRSLDQIPESWFMEERILGCPHIHVPSDHFSLLVELDLLTQPARGLAISDPSDATGLDNTTTVSAPAPSVTNSPKPKGSAVQRPKQGRR